MKNAAYLTIFMLSSLVEPRHLSSLDSCLVALNVVFYFKILLLLAIAPETLTGVGQVVPDLSRETTECKTAKTNK